MRYFSLVAALAIALSVSAAHTTMAQGALYGPSVGVLAPAAAHNVIVWVNVDTGVFHMPGSRWYGKTKHGLYMTETKAIRDGYRPSKNGQ